MGDLSQIPSFLSAVFVDPNGSNIPVKGISQELVNFITNAYKTFGLKDYVYALHTDPLNIKILQEATASSFSSLRGVYNIGEAPANFKDCVIWLEEAIERGKDYTTWSHDYSNKILSYILEKIKESEDKVPPKQIISNIMKQLKALGDMGGKSISRLKNTASIISTKEGKEAKTQLIRNATEALAAIKILAKLPVRTAVSVIGKGGVAGIYTAEFIVLYVGTRILIENTKTGKKIDTAVTNSMEKLFWSHFTKTQDVLAKKPPAERERLQKLARQSLDKFLDEIGVFATKSVIYAKRKK